MGAIESRQANSTADSRWPYCSTISTRLFWVLPASVELLATGDSDETPWNFKRSGDTPYLPVSSLATDLARLSDNFMLAEKSPRAVRVSDNKELLILLRR